MIWPFSASHSNPTFVRTDVRGRQIERNGFWVVYEPATAPKLDIIFLHGLEGDCVSSFTDRTTEQAVYLPQDLLPLTLKESGLDCCRLISVGYDARTKSNDGTDIVNMNFHQQAQGILEVIAMHRSREGIAGQAPQEATPEKLGRPIVFLAHSLGALILKLALNLSANLNDSEPFRQKVLHSVYLDTKAILFCGAPNSGTNLARILKLILSISGVHRRVSTETLKVLQPDSEINKINQEAFLHNAGRYYTVNVIELLPTPIMFGGGIAHVIVPEESAKIFGQPNTVDIHLPKDHRGIVKFPSLDDESYQMFVGGLLVLCRQVIQALHAKEQESIKRQQQNRRSRWLASMPQYRCVNEFNGANEKSQV